MTTLRKTAVYAHPPAHVWVALTDPHALAEWLFSNDFKPVVGHRSTFQTDPVPLNKLIRCECEVLEVVEHRRMVWSWTVVNRGGEREQRLPMRITWTLAPEGPGTRLTLEQDGIEQQSLFMRLLTSLGWSTMLGKTLPKVLANVRNSVFTPGAIPLVKRVYKADTVPAHLVR